MRQFADSLHQLLFIFRVYIGSRLVKNNNRGILHHSAGNRKSLPLAAGKGTARLSDNSLISLRQLHDKIMTARFLCSPNNLFHRSIGLTKPDIIGYRIMKEINILKYKAEIFHQAVHIIFTDIYSTKHYRALVHIPKSGKQMAERSFSTARGSDNGSCALFRNIYRYSINNFPLIIRKADIFCTKVTTLWQQLSTRGIHYEKPQNFICLIDTGIHHPQKRGLCASLL